MWWPENYGTKNSDRTITSQFSLAFSAIKRDSRVFLLGCMQALFEGAMYTFVFLWTPILSKGGVEISHGFIFANFMLSCMVGSAIAGYLMSSAILPELYMQIVFALGSICMVTTSYLHEYDKEWGLEKELASNTCFILFCLFEIIVGIFWPSMMKLRSQYIPEEVRSTVMNIFRMPLNLFVCIVLFHVSETNLSFMLLMCALFLFGACFCQHQLYRLIQ
jgi:MFS transporter, MFS domain-containing protein family, molybdate-anion transporter